jgi:hypothetical protein
MSTRLKPDVSSKLVWRACLDGREPAESLTPALRERLVAILLGRGWPVAAIAEHTFMSTYTADRICSRVRLRRSDNDFQGVA